LGVVAAVAGLVSLPVVSASAQPTTAPWHLDRINQRTLPLDTDTNRGVLSGADVDIYVVDSGVRADHVEFGGRVVAGTDIPSTTGSSEVTPPASDCDGHGTHVAGLSAGATVGVAPGARIIAVRVLDCNGDGEVDEVVEALKWVRAHHRGGRLAVVNMSLGVDLGDDGTAINSQVTAMIDEGMVVTVAAGNGDSTGRGFDACRIAPGDVARALTVGAVTAADVKATYSNFGSCIDLWAPGGDRVRPIESAWKDSADDYGFDIGTSMASPLVAGYAALLGEQQPGLCPDQMGRAIVERATPDAITGLDAASPNRLLFLDTAPIAAAKPGRPSHVMVTADATSLVVSWDEPCDGGSPITGTTVSVLSKGKVVARAEASPGTTAVRVRGLRTGSRYQVVVKTRNDVGAGVATKRLTTPILRTWRSGRTVSASSIGVTDGGLTLRWTASSATTRVCRVAQNPARVVFLRPGTCRLGLRTLAGQKAVVRNISVRP
jgi:subtilisin family serine protease